MKANLKDSPLGEFTIKKRLPIDALVKLIAWDPKELSKTTSTFKNDQEMLSKKKKEIIATLVKAKEVCDKNKLQMYALYKVIELFKIYSDPELDSKERQGYTNFYEDYRTYISQRKKENNAEYFEQLKNNLQAISSGQYKGFKAKKDKELSTSGKLKAFLHGTVLEFEEFEVQKDNSCGFYVLGISRKELGKILLPHVGNIRMREELAQEILNEMKVKGLGEAATLETNKLFDQSTLFEEQRAKIEADLKGGIEGCLSQLNQKEKSKLTLEEQSTMKKLEDHLQNEENCNNAMKELALSEEMYKKYVNYIMNNTSAWIGYKMAKLIAQVKGINLYIWIKSRGEYLDLKECYEDLLVNTSTIHMLHTERFTHFNLLAQSLDVADKQEARAETATGPLSLKEMQDKKSKEFVGTNTASNKLKPNG
jgi:hypothetical protein